MAGVHVLLPFFKDKERNLKKRFLFFVFLFCLCSSLALALEVPNLQGRVNDYANMLTVEQKENLEKKFEQYEKETSNQIVILTIPSLENEVLEEFSIKVADKWKIGQKGKDNGVIFLVAKNDRKMRIEVGKGLEGSLTDLTSGRIIAEMTPYFKNGAYYDGINAGMDKVILAIKGEYKGDGNEKKIMTDQYSGVILIFGLLVIVVGLFGFIHNLFGGIAGAVAAPALTAYLFHPGSSMLLVAAVLGFSIGSVARYVDEVAFAVITEGGLLGGRGGGFGGGGGGGFGGGGGGFGGGGASGGW